MSGVASPGSPQLYPLQLQGGRVGLLSLGEEDYRHASFLDARLLESGRQIEWRDFVAFADEQASGPTRRHFIFHISHVGSTLLSRLLGEHPALFSLREPALLRAIAAGQLVEERDPLLDLFSRVWRPEQTALIKATSLVSVIAPGLMARSDGGAILLAATPPTFLRAILGGSASRQDTRAMLPVRQWRLERRMGIKVAVDGEGEGIALSWLCEMLSLCDLAEALPQRCLLLDFDRVLAEPQPALRLAFAHLGVDPDAIDVAALVEGPLMRRYSKGPEHAYDADLRRRVLEQAGQEEAVELRRGMDWLQRMHATHPAVAPVLQRAAAAARASLAATVRRV